MAEDVSLSLPRQLHSVFGSLRQLGTAVPGNNGFGAWAKVLECAQEDPAFYERMSLVSRACAKLLQDVRDLREVSDGTREVYIRALTRLAELTRVSLLSQNWEAQGSKRILESDIDHLMTLESHLVRVHGASVLRGSAIDEIAASMDELLASVKQAEIEKSVKGFLAEEITNLLYFLRHVDKFGFDGVWQSNSRVFAAFTRYEAYLKARNGSTVWNSFTEKYSAVTQALITAGAIYAGGEATFKTGEWLFHSALPKLIPPAS